MLCSALAATIANTTDTTISITAGDGADKFPTDCATYNVIICIDQEYMLVTGLPTTDKLEVTRGYGSTTKATHANEADIHIISQIETEGATGKAAHARARTRPSNYIQTFSRVVEISGVEEAVRKLGGVTSELSYQIGQRARELALELEKTLIFGVAAAVGSSSTPRTMAGLWKLIETNRTSDSGSIDEDAIETDIRTIWDAGGNPNVILTTGALAQDINALYEPRIRSDVMMTVGGANIVSIINPLAQGPLYVIPHRLLRTGEYYMLDMGRIALGFLRPFFLKELAEDGDSIKRWIGGDYTLELMNEKAHAYRYGFS